MKVLMTADTVGGVWTYALELARALAPHGVEVVLATMGAEPTEPQRAEAHAVPNLDLRPSGFRLEWMEEPWSDVAAAGEWLLSLERDVRPDVVQLNNYAHGGLPWRRPPIVVGHSCVLSWWDAVLREGAPASWDRYRREVGRGLRAAAHVVAPTRAMLEALRRHYGPLPPASVIPNGRRAALFPPGEKRPMVLAAGRMWDQAKNLRLLAQAAPAIAWPVCVAGPDREPGGNGLASYESATYLGHLRPAELAARLAEASIYALPAKYEPFGLSVLEAALAGCALVVGDIPSLREVWGNAAVYYVDTDDAEALAAAVNALIADAPRRGELAGRARARALELTPRRMAERYVALYRAAIAPSRSAIAPEAPPRPARGPLTGAPRRPLSTRP